MIFNDKTYHIIGGGIAGLSCAKFIKQKSPQSEVVIYEAANHLGGRCYSYYDKKLGTEIDNATHVVLKANSQTCNLLKNRKFHKKIRFWKNCSYNKPLQSKDEIALAIFNTPYHEVDKSIIKTVFWKLFPFLPYKLKTYFSQNNLTKNLIVPLSEYADEIKLHHKLQSVNCCGEKISELKFNKEHVVVDKNDVVISALDAANYSRIFEAYEFEYNSIINIHYRTSMPITLPQDFKLLGIKDCLAQWVFINREVLSVTISNANDIKLSNEELAHQVWKEICTIRGREPAFTPAYRVIRHKRATIKQDTRNNSLRPISSQTQYRNLQLAGDWTMKDFPCCLEASVQSAKRIADKI